MARISPEKITIEVPDGWMALRHPSELVNPKNVGKRIMILCNDEGFFKTNCYSGILCGNCEVGEKEEIVIEGKIWLQSMFTWVEDGEDPDTEISEFELDKIISWAPFPEKNPDDFTGESIVRHRKPNHKIVSEASND